MNWIEKLMEVSNVDYKSKNFKERLLKCVGLLLCTTIFVAAVVLYFGGGFVLHFFYWLITGKNILK